MNTGFLVQLRLDNETRYEILAPVNPAGHTVHAVQAIQQFVVELAS